MYFHRDNTFAVDLPIGSIIESGGVQGAAAVGATETPLVPDAVLADHLFGRVYCVATPAATLARGGFETALWLRIVYGWSIAAIGAHQGGSVPETETFGSEEFAVAGAAMDLLVGAVASQD